MTSKTTISGEQGFTLIELLVVILIIGILLAIAAPSFLNQQDKAKDSEALQNLAIGYKVAKADAALNDGDFEAEADLRASISESEPQISVAAGTTPAMSELAVVSSSADDLELAFHSKSGKTCTATVTDRQAPVYGCPGNGGSGGGGGSPTTYTALVSSTADGYYQLDGDDGNFNGDACVFGVEGIPGTEGNPAVNANGDCWYDLAPLPTLGNSFSVELWFKSPHSFAQGVLHLDDSSGDSTLWVSSLVYGGEPVMKLAAAVQGGGYIEAYAPWTNDGDWHQMVATFTYSGGVTTSKFYRDGALVFTELAAAEIDTSGTVSGEVGRSRSGQSTPLSMNMWGSMDELSFYSTPLTDAEVLEHYELGTQTP